MNTAFIFKAKEVMQLPYALVGTLIEEVSFRGGERMEC